MIRTTYRKQSNGGSYRTAFRYYTKTGAIRCGEESITLYGWGTYGTASVLAGQGMKTFLGCFASDAELSAALIEAGINPEDVNYSSKFVEPQNTYNHLPDTQDW